MPCRSVCMRHEDRSIGAAPRYTTTPTAPSHKGSGSGLKETDFLCRCDRPFPTRSLVDSEWA